MINYNINGSAFDEYGNSTSDTDVVKNQTKTATALYRFIALLQLKNKH